MEGSRSKECVSLPEVGHNLCYCAESGVIGVWNKHSIFLYQINRLSEKPIHLVTDFIVQQVILWNTTVVCLDSNGVIHTMTLGANTPRGERVPVPFAPRAQGVLALTRGAHAAVCLSRHEQLLISLHKITSEFKTIRKYPLTEISTSEYQERLLFAAKQDILIDNNTKTIFKYDGKLKEATAVVFSLDRRTLYGVIIDQNKKDGAAVRLFTCPSRISSLYLRDGIGVDIVVGLQSGTLVILSAQETSLQAKIVHLNTAIYNMIETSPDTVLYGDGDKTWITNLKQKEIQFKRLFVTQAKQYLQCGQRTVCITFSNILYNFMLNDETIIKDKNEEGFVPLPRDLTASKDIVNEIMKEIEKNEVILNKIKSENTLMLATALSKHTSVLNEHVMVSTRIVHTYEDVNREYDDVTLTTSLREYFKNNVVVLMVTLKISSQFRSKFYELCSCLRNNLQLHISTKTSMSNKTHTVVLGDRNEGITCAVPVRIDEPFLTTNVELVSPIPEAMNPKRALFTTLYSKDIQMNAEHFIRIDEQFKPKTKCKAMDETVLHVGNMNLGAIYELKLEEPAKLVNDWCCYIKLPKDYRDKLANTDLYARTLSRPLSEYLSRKLGSPELCTGARSVHVSVCGGSVLPVSLQITHDTAPVLSLVGRDARVVCHLRVFLSHLLHADTDGSQFIPQSHYTRVENLQRVVRQTPVGAEARESAHTLLDVVRQLHQHTIGALPL